MALKDPELQHIAPDLRRRIEKTTSVRATDRLDKVPDAGAIRVVDGREVQVMHNGVLVEKDCYGGPWMTEVIARLRGHHEPQEEIAFAAIVDRLKEDDEPPVMIELGSYWAYYSLWLKSEIPDATVGLVEPDPANLQVGVRNFELNGLRPSSVLQAAVGVPHDSTVDIVCESDGVLRPIRAVTLDGLLRDLGLPRLDLLVCDVQGAEVEMLAGAVETVQAGNVRFMVISTHWSDTNPLIHQFCRARVQELGGHIVCEHSLPESCSADGLIVASFDPRDRDMRIDMPVVRAVDSEVGELEWMIARRMGLRGIVWGAVDLVPTQTRQKLGATALGAAVHRRLAARGGAAGRGPDSEEPAQERPRASVVRRGVRALAESDLQQRIESERHTRQFARSMDRHAEDFAGPELPRWYGVGLTERAVEFGWVRHHLSGRRVLDAGSALNHEAILDRILPVVDELTIVTLEPEAHSSPERGVRYLYQDLRHLEIPDGSFDTVVSVSTLEHVGLDNSRFYDSDAPQGDPDADAQQAMRELRRVAKPGGRLLITVPFGASWRSDWVRVFDAAQLDALIAAAGPAAVDESVFRRYRGGWRRVSRAQAADATYRRFWSEAVACVRIELPDEHPGDGAVDR